LAQVGGEPPGPHVAAQLSCSVVLSPCRAVWPRLDHRLVAVGGGEEARRRCKCFSAEACRVAGAVEPFSDLADEMADGRERDGLAQHSLAELGYEADALPLGHTQRA